MTPRPSKWKCVLMRKMWTARLLKIADEKEAVTM